MPEKELILHKRTKFDPITCKQENRQPTTRKGKQTKSIKTLGS